MSKDKMIISFKGCRWTALEFCNKLGYTREACFVPYGKFEQAVVLFAEK